MPRASHNSDDAALLTTHGALPAGARAGRADAPSRCLRPSAAFVPFGRDDIEQAVSRRFERQAERHPQRLAVKSRRHEFTYAELNRLANRIAHAVLARRGERQESVALLMEQDAPLYAAVFGILKAGKCYVPLSPFYPPARNALLLEDSRAALLVTDGPNAGAARALAGERAAVLNVDELDSGGGDANPGLDIAPERPVYILYTSGTTGRPKGVMECHRNLLHNVRNYTNEFFLGPEDRLTCLGSCAYSGSLKDIYGALLNGAALLPLDVQREGLAGLAGWVSGQAITVYDSVPTVFRHFLRTLAGDENLSRVRIVRLGGEPVTRKDVESFRRHFSPGCVLVNGYGATETGTACTYVLDHQAEVAGSAVPVGYPSEGMEVLVLDGAGREVSPGKVGQIAVRSDYLALGYWDQPELTRRAFRRDADGPGGRFYLTGDMGYRLPDGCLVCAGREDSQVKVRGHRIELAEVELALLAHPAVKEAAAVARSDRGQEPRLVAYVVPRDEAARPTAAELRHFLGQRLPRHAVPSAFVPLAALPLGPNGKLDQKSLPAPAPAAPDEAAGPVPPRDDVERRLADIWQRLLEVSPVGVRDNFFELGGDSLAAAHVCIQVQKAFGKEIPLAVLFEGGTIEHLAGLIRRDVPPARAASTVVPLRAGGGKAPFFCVHGIGGEVVSLGELAQHLGAGRPVYGIRARGVAEGEAALETIEDMAAAYVADLLAVQPEGPYYLGGYSCGGVVAFEMAQRLLRMGHAVGLLAMIDQRRPNLVPGAGWDFPGAVNFCRNLAHWLRDDALRTPAAELLARCRIRLRALRRRAGALVRSRGRRPAAPAVGDFVDLARLPDRYRRLWEVNYRALRAYVPRPYAGRMHLFRARSQPLAPGDWHRRDMGWSGLATGGLTIVGLPGTHDTILRDPHVRVLARKLDAALSEMGHG